MIIVLLFFLVIVFDNNSIIVLGDSVTVRPKVIDIGALINPNDYSNEEILTVKSLIKEACQSLGFFYIVNHNISDSLQDAVYEQMVLFFNSSKTIKNSVRRQLNNSRGYADNELTKQKLDMKEVFDFGQEVYQNLSEAATHDQALDGENVWPIDESLSQFREIVQSYYEECRKVSAILMEAILSNLNCDSSEHYIKESFHQHTSFLRLNKYPIVENEDVEVSTTGNQINPEENLGVSRHTDAGALTILMQDMNSALEVYSGSKQDFNDGEWLPVDPIPRALTINIGDMVQVWSNDVFKAPEHRVKASRYTSRYSIPFFYNPSYDTQVHPILCTASESSKYNDIRWGYFRTKRYLGDYENNGKEIQIEDFRIV